MWPSTRPSLRSAACGDRSTSGLLLDGDGPGQGLEIGDWVLVHVGFAMSKMDAEEAERTLTFMRELGEYFDEEISQFRESPAI